MQQRKKPLVEPDFAYTKDSVSGIGQLYKESKEYDPFATTKTESQFKEPLTFFDTLSKKVSTSYLEQQKPLIDQREALIKKRDEELKNKLNIIIKNNVPAWGIKNPQYARIWNSYQSQISPIEQQISRLGSINRNVYGSQTKTLGELSAELKNIMAKILKIYLKNNLQLQILVVFNR